MNYNGKNKKLRIIAVISVLIIASASMIYGISRNETDYILKRGINICLECIGIE